MIYRKRITLWAAVIAIGTVIAVSSIERLRAYKLADIISDEAALDSLDAAAADTATGAHNAVADTAATYTSAADTTAADTTDKLADDAAADL